jgi:WD40 repeat protein
MIPTFLVILSVLPPGEPDTAVVLPGKLNGLLRGVVFSRDGRLLAVADEKEIVVWHIQNAKPILRVAAVEEIKDGRDWINALALSADGAALTAVSHHGILKVWDLATGKETLRVQTEQRPLIGVGFLADNKSVASLTGIYPWSAPPNFITTWDVKTGKRLGTVAPKQGTLMHGMTSFSGDGRLLAASSYSFEFLKVWDLSKGEELFHFDDPVRGPVVFRADSKQFAANVRDEGIVIWDVKTGRALHALKALGKDDLLRGLTFAADGKRLIAVVATINSEDLIAGGPEKRTLRVWDIASDRELERAAIEEGTGFLSFSADGRRGAWLRDGRIEVRKVN